MRKIIFFDLDGTILDGISSENAFILYLLRNKYLRFKQHLASITFIFKWIFKFRLEVLLQNKAYLTGFKVEEIEKIAHDFVVNNLFGKIRASLKELITLHQKRGDFLVLLTGAPEFIARIFARHLGFDQVCATKLSTRGEIFTNAPPLQHPFAKRKLALAKMVCAEYETTLAMSTAYGNSINDYHLLEKVGTPIAVTPDFRLKKLAKRNKWPILGD